MTNFIETKERAEREAADWAKGMTGVAGEFYRKGFLHGFQLGHMAAERDARGRMAIRDQEDVSQAGAGDVRGNGL